MNLLTDSLNMSCSALKTLLLPTSVMAAICAVAGLYSSCSSWVTGSVLWPSLAPRERGLAPTRPTAALARDSILISEKIGKD